MTNITGTVKFDQELWDARSAGYCAEGSNPYLVSSSKWAAWETGRAYGLGRISQARGLFMNVAIDNRNCRISFDELAAAQARVMAISYMHGVR